MSTAQVKILLVFFILIFAWILQSLLFLNSDVSTLLSATQKLLSGGNYIKEIFTPNPPWILYLYTPPVFLSNLTNISIIFIFRAYIFFTIIISLVICYNLTHKISKNYQKFPAYLFTITLIIVFTLLPLHDFGERDHMLVIFTLPYYLMLACRLEKISIKNELAIIIGFFAGLGFLMKPHFFIPLILTECFYLYSVKRFFSWLRPEIVILILMLTFYTLGLYYFHFEYISFVVPYLLKNYLYSTGVPIFQLIYNLPIIFCIFVVFFYFILDVNSNCKYLFTLLLLTVLGNMLCFFLQYTTYYYHVIPAFSFALILFALEAHVIFTNIKNVKQIFHIFPLTILLIFLLPIYITFDIYKSSIQYKKSILIPIVQFLKQQGSNNSIYVFSPNPRFGFPIIDYAHSNSAQRFDCLWMIDGLTKQIHQNGDKIISQRFKNNEYAFFRMLMEDININRPAFVLIDADTNKHHTGFNYLHYFLQNENFKKIWFSYTFFKTIQFKNTDRILYIYRYKN